MKLRNKKTGEITDLAKRGLIKSDNDNHIIVYPEGTLKYYAYDSLAELNEEWEDYKPAEPLIKDEKIRKAVRAWAEALYLRGAIFDFDDGTMMLRGEKLRANISFDGLDFCEFKHITAGYHTIDQLCGEESE